MAQSLPAAAAEEAAADCVAEVEGDALGGDALADGCELVAEVAAGGGADPPHDETSTAAHRASPPRRT
ncbi:MAG TPA: hypothetical protein VFN41_11355 [Candidatus Limnocylindrales bacterium]|nr:hypothetical protein [Candidatus Limnocylindrales bacterium]